MLIIKKNCGIPGTFFKKLRRKNEIETAKTTNIVD